MTSQRITIALLMPLGSQVGGAEALLVHLLRNEDHRYRYVCAFLQDGPLVEEVRALGYDTTVFPATRVSDKKNYLKMVWALRSWLNEKQPYAAVSWMSKGHIYLGIAALFLDVKVLWYQHSVPSGTAYIDRFITTIPTKGVLCCSGTSQNCQDQLFPARQTFVCYPGVLMPLKGGPSQAEAREKLGLPKDAPVIGMVARLERWKGGYVFVLAARQILDSYPDARLFIVGGPHSLDPKYAEEVADMVKALDCGDRFILAGQRPMTEALLWQTAADVIVHPVTGVEPFGMAVVEAMAQGKVVVATNIGGPSEIIHDGIDGILIDRKNPKLLASTLVDLLDHPEKIRAIEQQAYDRGRSFSIPAFASRFEDIVAEVLAQ
jgi:glycosyltransferase involved in cell wall biosynthesis